jgi:26S proteasome regulatory subunit N8
VNTLLDKYLTAESVINAVKKNSLFKDGKNIIEREREREREREKEKEKEKERENRNVKDRELISEETIDSFFN